MKIGVKSAYCYDCKNLKNEGCSNSSKCMNTYDKPYFEKRMETKVDKVESSKKMSRAYYKRYYKGLSKPIKNKPPKPMSELDKAIFNCERFEKLKK